MDSVRVIFKKPLFPGLLLLILILLATLPFYRPGYTVILLTHILMYTVLTVSWAIFSGPTGYISLASAAFFGLGIYASAILGEVLPLPAVIGIGALASFILALLFGALTLRLRGMYFIMFSFGLVMLMAHLANWCEANIRRRIGFYVVLVDDTTVYYIILIIFVMALLTAYLIRRSKYGLALQSIGENEEAAAHRGINVTVVKVITFAISAIFMGAAGAIMATKWTYVEPFATFHPLYSFMPVLMALFGGMGQLYGPIMGAAIFAYLEELLITRFPYHYMVLFGIILVVAILYLPNGVVGLVQRWRKGGLEGQHANTWR